MNMLVYLEELKNLKETVRNVAEELTGVKSTEVPQNLEKVFKEDFTIKKTIIGFRSHLSHEVSSIDKENLVSFVSSFLEELTSYIAEWNSLFEKSAAGCSLEPGDLYHLLAIAIADTAELLTHCKESIHIYEKCFHEVSAFLSNLFKSAYHILKVVLDILDKACLEQCGKNDISKFAKCIIQLFDVSLVLNDIDVMPLGNTLRCLNRIICSKGNLINEELDGDLMFKCVCTCILDKLTFAWSIIQESSQKVDSKRLSTVIKLLRFLFGMLLRLIKNYKNSIFGYATRYVISVLMSLQWMTPKSVHEELNDSLCYKEFCNAILVVIEPLVIELIDERDFIARFQAPEEFVNSNEESAKHDLSALQLTVTIACCLAKAKDETKDEWMNELASSSCHSVVDLALLLYERCQKQNLQNTIVPMAVEVEQNPRNIPLHEYVCIGLCAFASTLRQENYVKLERCLLKNVMFSSKSTYILAADVISFIARWGTDDLCFQLTNFFAHLSLSLSKDVSIQSEFFNRSLQMMRRLYLLLGDSKKDDFLKSCLSSFKDCIAIWFCFPFESLDERRFRENVDLIVASTLEALEVTKNDDQQKKAMVLKVWENCLKKENALEFLSPTHLNGIVKVVTDLFLSLEKSDCERIDEELICSVMGVTSHVVHALDHISGILKVAAVLLQCNASSNMSFKVCQLLSAIKSVHFETEYKELCLSNVSTLFSKLLAHESFFVRYEAMKSLRAFAEVTNHPEVIADCLPATTTESFTDFLNNVRFLDDMPLSNKDDRLKRALTISSAAISKQSLSGEESDDISTSPKFLRSCSEASASKELDVIEKEFESAVGAIIEYWQVKRIPEPILKSLKSMAKVIEQLGTV